MKSLLVLLALVSVVLFSTQVAAANGDEDINTTGEMSPTDSDADDTDAGGFTADEDTNSTQDADETVERTATFVDSDASAPTQSATIDDGTGGTQAPAAVGVSAPSGPNGECIEETPAEYNAELDITYSAVCIKWRVCGAERVDDVVSGRIAGEDFVGRYASYLEQMAAFIFVDTYLIDHGLTDVASVSDFLLTQGLGEPPTSRRLPVFNWCALVDSSWNFDPVDVTDASFSWDLTIDDVYDIDGMRNDLYIELTALLDLYEPEVGLVPKAEVATTLVQWPTWMFLHNPLVQEWAYTTNDIDTVRIDLRATLLRVDWAYGDTQVASCEPSEMVTYNPDIHHPTDDVPPCHHIFTTVDTQDLSATITYRIEERIRARPSASLDPYPDTPWVDYLNTPTEIELTTTIVDYAVREVRSVNVAADFDSSATIADTPPTIITGVND